MDASQQIPSIVLLPGDGIGPEIVAAARTLLDAVGAYEYAEHPIGGVAIDETGSALPESTLAACRKADAVLLGAVGGPKWDTTDPDAPRPEQGLLGLRKGLGLYANLRPVKPIDALLDSSPLRRERIAGTDLLVVRELTGGIYFGRKEREPDSAVDECVYTRAEVERIALAAFDAARRRAGDTGKPRVTSVDKANVLESSRLWREVVMEVATGFPEVTLDHMLVDNAAMQLVSDLTRFDVIVTENMFGDILSDEAAMLTGSLGMLALRQPRRQDGPGVFNRSTAPRPTSPGPGAANPLATFLSAALMLRHGLGDPAGAERIEAAVEAALASGLRTADLATGAAGEREADTEEMTAAVLAAL